MTEMTTVEQETQAFELEQRKAKVYSESTLVPKEYQGKIGNVLIAKNMATRMNADLLMVMQNLYMVHGKPSWSAQFLIACFNTCGRFSAIKYRFTGEPGTDGYGCQAVATELDTGELIEGPVVTWAIAKAEGWVDKNGSKWKTMPELMFRYRAATFLIRTTAPEIGLGLMTKEEMDDTYVDGHVVERSEPKKGVAALRARIGVIPHPGSVADDTNPETNGGEITEEERQIRERLHAAESAKDVDSAKRELMNSDLTRERKLIILDEIEERIEQLEGAELPG